MSKEIAIKILFSHNQKQYMKLIFILLFITISANSFSQEGVQLRLKKGQWLSELQLTKTDILSFDMLVEKDGKNYSFFVINGEEKIALDSAHVINDSVHLMFPFFNSELVFHVDTKKAVSGYWQNYNKGDHYKIDFTSQRTKCKRTSHLKKNNNSINVHGKWELEFEHNTTSSYPAVGIFKQEVNSTLLTGTYLTETGDYRFLAGKIFGDSLYLSCFDGSHALLFKASNINGTLKGKFFSGSHWQSEWVAKRNDSI